jgi:hypothetical protein
MVKNTAGDKKILNYCAKKLLREIDIKYQRAIEMFQDFNHHLKCDHYHENMTEIV